MAETEESQQNLGAIRTDLEQVRAMQRFAIAATPGFGAFVKNHLEDKTGSAEVYLALKDKPLDLEGIMAIVKKSKGEVSKICSHLDVQGFISKIPNPTNKKGRLFVWTDLENVLGVSGIARDLIKERTAKKA